MRAPFNTPVVFMVFNRPEPTKEVMAAIAAARPRKLYVVADGPRPGRPGEAGLCAEVQKIATGVNWECEVITNISRKNLGCRARIASGIEWVFSLEEEAIFLEDDCLPSLDFFDFCEEMLARYRNEPKVMHITGSNFFAAGLFDASYSFSAFPHIWGWASWRRAWKHYDVNLGTWPALRAEDWLRGVFSRPLARRYWRSKFDAIVAGFNTWDYQWTFACLHEKGLCVIPARNLIRNIGFGADATHTTGSDEGLSRPAEKMEWPLKHPPLEANQKIDNIYLYKLCSPAALLKKILKRVF